MPSHPTLPSRSTISDLLERARKRLFGQLVLDKGALALVIGMAGAILLLLTGTQILDWYWPALLVVASLGAGIYRLRKSLPSFYRLAQQIDRRLGLADSLSTAVYFTDHPEPGREAVSECQRRDAELVAQRVDVRAAVPPSRSRYLLPAAGLALVAFGLFAVRYAVTGSLSLEPSLLRIAYDSFFGTPPQQLAKNQPKRPNIGQQPFDPGNPEAASNTTDQQPEDLFDANPPTDTANPQGDDNAKQASGKEGDQKDGDSDKKGADNANDKDGKDGKQGDKGDKGDKDGKEGKEGDQGAKDDKQGDNPSESLMDKIKDAVANVMNKLKPNSAQKQQQNAKNQPQDKRDKQDKNDQGDKGDKADQQENQKQSDDTRADNSPGGKQSEAESGKPNQQPGQRASQENANGAGSQDGEKAIREAKALEAMGQISEILGKRSATISGEMMVEVGSGKQQLKTAFVDRQAGHADTGGEIHRDEVPLMFQPFVERYFEEIRKSPTAKGK